MKLKQLMEGKIQDKMHSPVTIQELLDKNEKELKTIEKGSMEDLEKLAKVILKEWNFGYFRGTGKFYLIKKNKPTAKENVALALYNHFSGDKELSLEKMRTILKHTKEEGSDYLGMLKTKKSQDRGSIVTSNVRQVRPGRDKDYQNLHNLKYRNKKLFKK